MADQFRLLGRKLGFGPSRCWGSIFRTLTQSSSPIPTGSGNAEFLVRAMREVHPHGPYHLAGLCVNAVIAYEVARQLQLEGKQVALLAMFDGHNHAYYKSPFRDGRSPEKKSRVGKYHLANLLQLDFQGEGRPDF